MNLLKVTGGARIGNANVTWPFATLTVTKDRLDLNASIIGNYSFTKYDIISINPYHVLPILGQGIKINHKISKYKDNVIFWTFNNPDVVINEIKKIGFLNVSSTTNQEIVNQIIKRQKQGGFPVRIPAIISVIIIWNILFLADFLYFKTNVIPLGTGVASALGFVIIVSILTLISKKFRKLILKNGRDIEEINKFLYFLMLICGGILFSILLIIWNK